jgi:PAS domain-containing protein
MSRKPLFLIVEQARERLTRLLNLSSRIQNKFKNHLAGLEYTSVMISFLLEEISSVETLLRLSKSIGNEWFPINIGYMIARSMFEIDVNAHYITKDKINLSHQYIEYVHVLRKKELDTIMKYKDTNRKSWREFLQLWFRHYWESRTEDINNKFNEVKPDFEEMSGREFQSWSGKNIREMAREVDHELEYDISYSKLSSFVRADSRLADRVLKKESSGSIRALKKEDYEVGFVLEYSATFFDCFLRLFGNEFKLWTEEEVNACWKLDNEVTLHNKMN